MLKSEESDFCEVTFSQLEKKLAGLYLQLVDLEKRLFAIRNRWDDAVH